MKKIAIRFFLFLGLLLIACSCQKESTPSLLYGSWRITKVFDKDGNETDHLDLVVTFSKGSYETNSIGDLSIQEWGESGADRGVFFYDSDKNQLTWDIIEADGIYLIKKLTRKRMILYETYYGYTIEFSKF